MSRRRTYPKLERPLTLKSFRLHPDTLPRLILLAKRDHTTPARIIDRLVKECP